MLKRIIATLPLLLNVGCMKYYIFNDVTQTLPTASVGGIWMAKASNNNQYLKIQLKNKSNVSMFVDWNDAKMKIGNDKLSLRVQPKYDAYIVNSSSVFNAVPSVTYKTSSNPFYGSGHIIAPEALAEKSMPVTLMFKVCFGELSDGLRPSNCDTGGGGWKVQIVKAKLHFTENPNL